MSLSSVENAAPHRLFPTLNAVHGLRSAAVIGTRYGASLQICASADDIWINKERRTNTAGEWCCNAFDCAGDRRGETKVTPRGYVLENGEMIPHSNAAISGDGQYWQCRRSDKSSRCFFFPPSAT